MATKKKTKTPARRKRATTARASSVRGSVARRIEREHDALAATEADHHAIEHCSCELAAQWRDAQSMPPPQPRPARKFGLTFLELRALAEVASPNEIVRAAHRALQAGTITPEQSDAAENWAIAKADAGIEQAAESRMFDDSIDEYETSDMEDHDRERIVDDRLARAARARRASQARMSELGLAMQGLARDHRELERTARHAHADLLVCPCSLAADFRAVRGELEHARATAV